MFQKPQKWVIHVTLHVIHVYMQGSLLVKVGRAAAWNMIKLLLYS